MWFIILLLNYFLSIEYLRYVICGVTYCNFIVQTRLTVCVIISARQITRMTGTLVDAFDDHYGGCDGVDGLSMWWSWWHWWGVCVCHGGDGGDGCRVWENGPSSQRNSHQSTRHKLYNNNGEKLSSIRTTATNCVKRECLIWNIKEVFILAICYDSKLTPLLKCDGIACNSCLQKETLH